jgi:hypothetical protein
MISITKTWRMSRKLRHQSTCQRRQNEIDIEKGIEFLTKKGVYSSDPVLADLMFQRLREPDLLAQPSERIAFVQARERLIRLVSTEEEFHSDTVPDNVHRFTHEEFPGYEDENVFFLHHPNSLSQRYQRSGLCYMHAPAMVQHYAIQKNAKSNLPMLDLLKYVKEHFTADQLREHVFKNEGGDSIGFLKSILQPDPILVTSAMSTHVELYNQHGPGLVSRFELHEDFWDSSKRHHYGKSTGKCIGNHAMAFVGHRSDKVKNKSYFLLQNWWQKKQFVEVDEEYLKHSGAIVTFIETPQTHIPDNFSIHYGKFYELEGVDKPEGLWKEMNVHE